MMKRARDDEASAPADEDAGAREAFEDAALYDFEYRRRRADVTFYRRLAAERLGYRPDPALDLACGTGRLLVPLVRDGHHVLGVDRAPAMLARAAARVRRMAAVHRARCALARADLRALACAPRFGFAVCAFHSVQHIIEDDDLVTFFRAVKSALVPDAWFAFDVLPPSESWLARSGQGRWGRTVFHHPVTRQRTIYTASHDYDPVRRALHMRLYYQPIDAAGRSRGKERVVRLCHRQLDPATVERLLARAGFSLLARYGGFDGRPLDDSDKDADQHVYLARPGRRARPWGSTLDERKKSAVSDGE